MYTIFYANAPSFKKELEHLKRSGVLPLILKNVNAKLTTRPLSFKPLGGPLAGLYRMQVLKDWRVIYQVFQEERRVLIIAIRPRNEKTYDDEEELMKRTDA